MPISVNSNLSALDALANKQNVTANNIANSASKEFKKSTAELEAGPNGSVTSRVQPVSTPGTMLINEDGSVQEMSNVDLGEELTDMIGTKQAYQANLKAFKTSDGMEKNVLDLIG